MASKSAHETAEFLYHHYLDSLIIDCCAKPYGGLPGARRFSFLRDVGEATELRRRQIVGTDGIADEEGNGFTNADGDPEGDFEQRIGAHVVVYDELGSLDGAAASLQKRLTDEGLVASCVFVEGGLRALCSLSPILLKYHPPPSTLEVDFDLLGSLSGIASTEPIQYIKSVQKALVDSVPISLIQGLVPH